VPLEVKNVHRAFWGMPPLKVKGVQNMNYPGSTIEDARDYLDELIRDGYGYLTLCVREEDGKIKPWTRERTSREKLTVIFGY